MARTLGGRPARAETVEPCGSAGRRGPRTPGDPSAREPPRSWGRSSLGPSRPRRPDAAGPSVPGAQDSRCSPPAPEAGRLAAELWRRLRSPRGVFLLHVVWAGPGAVGRDLADAAPKTQGFSPGALAFLYSHVQHRFCFYYISCFRFPLEKRWNEWSNKVLMRSVFLRLK